MTTWLVSNPQIGKGMGTQLMTDDQIQDYLAEYFATAERITDGTELVIRKADYLNQPDSPARRHLRLVGPFGEFEVQGSMTGRLPRRPPLGI